MKLDFTSEVPLYLQIGSALKEEILGGVYGEEEQVPSTTEISLTYKINPATVLKGYNLLVDEDIIYKRRGVGMFVKTGAVEKLKAVRKKEFYSSYVEPLLEEAQRLSISREELIAMFEEEKE